MATKKFVMSVKNYSKNPNPYDSNDKIVDHKFVVEIGQLSRELKKWFKTNPRMQCMNTDISKGIKNSLKSDHKLMHIMSNGLLFSAFSVTFDEKKKTVTMEFNDENIHGNLDGAHLLMNALEAGEGLHIIHYLSVTVVTGIETKKELINIASSRNTNAAVIKKSLYDFDNHFDELKRVLSDIKFKNISLNNRIAYKQFEHKDDELKLERILSFILGFDPRYNSDKKRAMYPSLSRQGKATLEIFTKGEFDVFPPNITDEDYKNSRDRRIRTMSNVIPDIINLSDHIEITLSDGKCLEPEINKALNKLVDGDKKSSPSKKLKIKPVSTFSSKTIKKSVSPLLVFILTMSMTDFIERTSSEDEMVKWRKGIDDIKDVWNLVANDVVQRLLDHAEGRQGGLLALKDVKILYEDMQKVALEKWSNA